MSISRIPETVLLAMPLRDLAALLDLSAMEKEISRLHADLGRRGLSFRPYLWIADDWFCPDGHAGFAVPFYLLHPRLIRMMRARGLKVEGAGARQRLRIMRHETGHAVDNAFGLRRSRRRQLTFGSSNRRYPVAYGVRAGGSDFVRHLTPDYAQSHPDEDWAETFAVWLDPDSAWRQRYVAGRAAGKLNCVDSQMLGIRCRQPRLRRRSEVDPISQSGLTLGEWLEKRRSTSGWAAGKLMDQALECIFSEEGAKSRRSGQNRSGPGSKIARTFTGSRLIRKHKVTLSRRLSRDTGCERQDLYFLLMNLEERARCLGSGLNGRTAAACLKSLSRHLEANAHAYLKARAHYVRM